MREYNIIVSVACGESYEKQENDEDKEKEDFGVRDKVRDSGCGGEREESPVGALAPACVYTNKNSVEEFE